MEGSLSTDAFTRHRETEQLTIHVLWMTGGLGCDGDTLAMTSATSPSLEDLIGQAIPGAPRLVIHNPVLSPDNGDEFMSAWYDAEDGRLDPYVLVVEGALGNEELSGEGHWSGLRHEPADRAADHHQRMGRPARPGQRRPSWRSGTCATYGGVPAMRNNPTGAMGLPDYLGWRWRSKRGLPIVCIPGCPAQPDNMTETLLLLSLHLAGLAPAPELDEQLRPQWLFGRTTRESCSRAGFTEQGKFATEYGADSALPREARLQRPCRALQRPDARLGERRRRLSERRRHLHRLHDARRSRIRTCRSWRPDPWGNAAANFQRFSYGPVFRYFRSRNLQKRYEREPDWRQPGPELTTGYVRRWPS